MPLVAPVPIAGECNFLLLREDLASAHFALSGAMAHLEQLTNGPLPDRGVIVETRWNISSASLARRTLWHRILTHVSGHRFDDCRADIRHLQDSDIALLRLSTAHVTRWSIDALIQDWTAYCEASKGMRDKMKAAMEVERTVLYPLLGGCQ